MFNWILGLVIFWGIVFVISCFSKRQDNSLTADDYEKMKQKWKEEEEEEKLYSAHLEDEPDRKQQLTEIINRMSQSKEQKPDEKYDDLPF